jgi:ankyrin repeat protein
MDALRVLVAHPELARQAATNQLFVIPVKDSAPLTVTPAQYAAHEGDLNALTVLTAIDQVREHEAAIVKPFNLVGLALHSGSRRLFNHVLKWPELQPLAGLLTISGCTPLMLAVWANDDALFAKLLALSAVRATVLSPPGARLPIKMQWPPSLPPQALPYKDVLDLAIQGGNLAMARSLLQVQEVLDAIDKRGDYAQAVLLRCINHRMPDLVLALLQRPLVAKIVRIPDSTGMTALHHAAQLGQTQVVEALLVMLPASEITRSNRGGKSAFLLAKEAGHEKTASILAAAAADAKAPLTQ